MRTLGKYIKPYLWRIALQMTVKISGTVIELFLPSMLSVILDEYAPLGDKTGVTHRDMAMEQAHVKARSEYQKGEP